MDLAVTDDLRLLRPLQVALLISPVCLLLPNNLVNSSTFNCSRGDLFDVSMRRVWGKCLGH